MAQVINEVNGESLLLMRSVVNATLTNMDVNQGRQGKTKQKEKNANRARKDTKEDKDRKRQTILQTCRQNDFNC